MVVSDMTCIYHKGVRWEWTYILDTYNNEIIASSVTNKRGNSLPYYHCLNKLIEKTKEQSYPVTLHTDQGSVYSSSEFYQTHKYYTNIKRSMSRSWNANWQSYNRIPERMDKRRNENRFWFKKTYNSKRRDILWGYLGYRERRKKPGTNFLVLTKWKK